MAQPFAPTGTSDTTFGAYTPLLAISVLSFGLIVILFVIIPVYKKNLGYDTIAMKIIGLTVVVTATIFVIVVGYSKDQISPVIGLFGAITGYLLGSGNKGGKNQSQ